MLAAERYLNLAREASADQDAPATYDSAAKSLRAARSSMMRQFGRPAFLRDYGETRRQILGAQKLTATALEEARTAVQGRAERLRTDIQQVRAEVAEVRGLLMNLPPRYHRALRFVVAAESRLLSAERAHTPQETRDAMSAVQTARGEVTHALQNVRGLLLGFLDRRSEWNQDLAETLAWTRKTGNTAVVVDKLNHRFHIVRSGRSIRSYPAEFGPAWLDKKVVEGDRATPEGRYKVVKKRGRGQTRYHKALLLNYPNGEDSATFHRLRRAGAVSHRARMGGLIEIHGDGGKGEDWTFGCVSLRNEHMDDVFSQLDIGSPVTIVGIWEEPSWLTRLLQTAGNTEP
jgi:lipoprotein-anchoring transpeptidase ErfK/SrfK